MTAASHTASSAEAGAQEEPGEQRPAAGWLQTVVDSVRRVSSTLLPYGQPTEDAATSSASAAAEIEKEQTFGRRLLEAKLNEPPELRSLDLVRVTGRDKEGRPIVWINGRNLPARGYDIDQVKWFIYSEMFEVINGGSFTVVYAHSQATWEDNCPGVMWVRQMYEDIPRKYKDNLGLFLVLHPALWLRLLLRLMGPWASSGFWSKLEYVDRVEFLHPYIRPNQISLPPVVHEHDRDLETQPLMDYGIYADHSNAQTIYPPGMSTQPSTYDDDHLRSSR